MTRVSRLPFVHSPYKPLLLLVACLLWLSPVPTIGSTEENYCTSSDQNHCVSSDTPGDETKKFRVISTEELASNTGATEGSRIWISIFGEVYDVTEGEGKGYYGVGGSYQVFAGKDATPCFTTGEFNDEGAKKDINDVPARELVAINEWKTFYADHDIYFHVGVLSGVYYDEEGKPTPTLENTLKRIEVGKVEAEKQRAERAAIRAQKLKEREAKKKAKTAKK